MDKILIDTFLLCTIGVSQEERKEKQKIIVHAELYLDVKKASESKNISDTVDYSLAYKKLKSLEDTEYILLETLAEDISRLLLSYKVSMVIVRVTKPRKDVNYSVEITRKNG
jgi:dihydroneopterin aldolase